MELYRRPEDWIVAYTAGLFDGEGSVGTSGKHAYKLSICQSTRNNGDALCCWLVEKWGIGASRHYIRECNNLGVTANMWQWTVCARRDVLWFLSTIEPYLFIKLGVVKEIMPRIRERIDAQQRWCTWVVAEDEYMRDHWHKQDYREIAAALCRTPDSIQLRARALGICHPNGKGWRRGMARKNLRD